ncbi:247_t:CDS:2, partial [Funneliformis mosseae]
MERLNEKLIDVKSHNEKLENWRNAFQMKYFWKEAKIKIEQVLGKFDHLQMKNTKLIEYEE